MVLRQMTTMEARVPGPPRNRSLRLRRTKMKAFRAASASQRQRSLPRLRQQHQRAQRQAALGQPRAGQLRQISLLRRPAALQARQALLGCRQALLCRAAQRTVSLRCGIAFASQLPRVALSAAVAGADVFTPNASLFHLPLSTITVFCRRLHGRPPVARGPGCTAAEQDLGACAGCCGVMPAVPSVTNGGDVLAPLCPRHLFLSVLPSSLYCCCCCCYCWCRCPPPATAASSSSSTSSCG